MKELLGCCADKGLAVMRLALGYYPALPLGWEPKKSQEAFEVVHSLGELFPNHRLLVAIGPPKSTLITHVPANVNILGEQYVLEYGEDNKMGKVGVSSATDTQTVSLDSCLIGWAYNGPPEVDDAAFVIGVPQLYDHWGRLAFAIIVLL